MKLALFEYHRRKAEAAMKKAEVQQQVVDYLTGIGYYPRYATEIAETGEDVRASGDLEADEATHVNKLLAKVREYREEGYRLERETVIV